jgi:hypothetical protein
MLLAGCVATPCTPAVFCNRAAAIQSIDGAKPCDKTGFYGILMGFTRRLENSVGDRY